MGAEGSCQIGGNIFVTDVEARIKAAVPHARVVMHGHIGDGNIHVIALIDRAR